MKTGKEKQMAGEEDGKAQDGALCCAWGKQAYVGKNTRKLTSISPNDDQIVGDLLVAGDECYEAVIEDAQEVFIEWRKVPAPERGKIVREIGNAFRDSKAQLGELVSREVGKIRAEGEGEIQEAIDIADFSVGLSRQLYGLVIQSERLEHRMIEQWHPLGPVAVITAFNFPVAVWAWNAMVAAVCGDVVIWKPSNLAPVCAVTANEIARSVAKQYGFEGVFSLLIDDGDTLGKRLAADPRIPLVSATGSCEMGRSVSEVVGRRLGRSILELGGNNAVTILDDADMDLAIAGVLFGAVGTAGQRCTSIRRVLVHRDVQDEFTTRLIKTYQQVSIGDPLMQGVLMGPLINQRAVECYELAIKDAISQGGQVLYGGAVLKDMPSGNFVEPTIILSSRDMPIVQEETFAPIVFVIPIDSLDEAISINNEVRQGLSSALFTTDMRSMEQFLASGGSDCGIANVNMGTSGAEIGGAFGGEKDTGGGRESGTDSWKQYMRRQTCSINYGTKLPLAQGIKFS